MEHDDTETWSKTLSVFAEMATSDINLDTDKILSITSCFCLVNAEESSCSRYWVYPVTEKWTEKDALENYSEKLSKFPSKFSNFTYISLESLFF